MRGLFTMVVAGLACAAVEAGWRDVFGKFDAIPNRKTDTNNQGPVSFDHIGANYDYPEASYERRREIIADHERYQQGMLWFLAHDDRVPADIRTRMRQWGLPKDEYGDNGHWSPQLSIREARRMIGDDVLTENECLGKREVDKPVGMGSYNLDSHNVRRYVTPDGTVLAARAGSSVQDVDYASLRGLLEAQGQVLEIR
jgi:hypothetical protein